MRTHHYPRASQFSFTTDGRPFAEEEVRRRQPQSSLSTRSVRVRSLPPVDRASRVRGESWQPDERKIRLSFSRSALSQPIFMVEVSKCPSRKVKLGGHNNKFRQLQPDSEPRGGEKWKIRLGGPIAVLFELRSKYAELGPPLTF